MKLTFLIVLLSLLTACGQKHDSPKRTLSTELKTSTHKINDDEHVTIIDIPDNYVGKRCWVYVNDKIKTSHMKCDDELTKTE